MAQRRKGSISNSRLQEGAAILAAARGVDARLIKDRLAAFERVHKASCEAQAKVDAADAALRTAQARLAELDLDQDEAVEKLAIALTNDGQPRTSPFAAFGAPSPAAIIKLPFAQEAQTIHTLVSMLQRKPLGKATQQAAQAADKAATAVEKAIEPIAALQKTAREARQVRDASSQGWETALAAVRRGARAAADDGAPQLHSVLFGKAVRASRGRASVSTAATETTPSTSTPAN